MTNYQFYLVCGSFVVLLIGTLQIIGNHYFKVIEIRKLKTEQETIKKREVLQEKINKNLKLQIDRQLYAMILLKASKS